MTRLYFILALSHGSSATTLDTIALSLQRRTRPHVIIYTDYLQGQEYTPLISSSLPSTSLSNGTVERIEPSSASDHGLPSAKNLIGTTTVT